MARNIKGAKTEETESIRLSAKMLKGLRETATKKHFILYRYIESLIEKGLKAEAAGAK